MFTFNKVYIATLISIFMTACSTSPVTLDAEHVAPMKYQEKKRGATNCKIGVNKVLDQRTSKISGSVAGRTITHDEIEKWLREVYIKTNNLDVDFVDDTNSDKNKSIDISVIKLYSRSASTSMSSNIVLKVNYFDRNNEQSSTQNIFRGQATNMNWGSSSNEIKGLFTDALIEAVIQTAESLSHNCT